MSDERHSPSGLPIKPVYGPGDSSADSENAGQFPYTRGIYANMYRDRLWTMRQYAGFGTAEETNLRFHELLEAGQTGLSVAFDLPTQMGYDSDAAIAEGEVGRAGVAIDTVDDFARLFDGIPLDTVSTSMTINATAAILLAMVCLCGRPLLADDAWVVMVGSDGPGNGKHIVLVSGDEEYRSEELIPQLAKILAKHHGFKCTVLFAIDRKDGTINPEQLDNIPGLEALGRRWERSIRSTPGGAHSIDWCRRRYAGLRPRWMAGSVGNECRWIDAADRLPTK